MRVPMASPLISRDGTTTKDGHVLNGLVESNGEQSAVRKRYGSTFVGAMLAGTAQLITYFATKVITIIGDVIGVDIVSPLTANGTAWTLIATAGTLPTDMSGGYTSDGSNTVWCVTQGYGANNICWKSTDYTNWTAMNTDITSNSGYSIDEICYFGGNLYAFAGGNANANLTAHSVYKSVDSGANWTLLTAAPAWASRRHMRVVVFNSKMWLIGGDAGNGGGYVDYSNVYYSTDGITWTLSTANYGEAHTGQVGAAVIGSTLYIVTDTYIYSSTDGVTFTPTASTLPSGSRLRTVLSYNSKLWIVKETTLSILYSSTGAAWSTVGTMVWGGNYRAYIYNGTTMVATTSNTAGSSSYSADRNVVTGTTVSITPGTSNLQYSAQDNGANAQSILFLKNAVKAWTLDSSNTLTTITDTYYPGNYSVNIVSLTRSGTVATAALAQDVNFEVGSSVVIAGATPTDYNGTKTVTTVQSSSAGGANPIGITITRSSTTATATCISSPHGFTNGQTVIISGAAQSAYNGQFAVTVTSPTVFTFTVSVTAATSGTASTVATYGPVSPATGSISISIGYSYDSNRTRTEVSVSSNSTLTTLPITPSTNSFVVTTQFDSLGNPSQGTFLPVTFTRSGNVATGTTTGSIVGTVGTQVPAWIFYAPTASWGGDDSKYQSPQSTRSILITSSTTFTFILTGNEIVSFYLNTPITVSSITRSGTLATGTVSGVTLVSGLSSIATINGATDTAYNKQSVMVTAISTTQFTYTISLYTLTTTPGTSGTPESPATTATGTISVSGSLPQGSQFTFTIAGSPTTPATGTITASGGRNTVPGVAYLDGYFFVMDVNGVIYNCNPAQPTNWTPVDGIPMTITAEAVTGSGIAIAKSLNYIVAFKEWSTEFFYDAANDTGSPLLRMDQALSQIGCASGNSVAGLDGNLLFLSQNKEEGRGVYLLAGIQMQKVSTPDVERILMLDTLSSVFAYGMKLDGHALYILTLVNTAITLVFDTGSQIWSEWSSLTLGSAVSVTSITQTGGLATVTCTGHGLSDGDPVLIAGANQSGYNGIQQAMVTSSSVFTFECDSATTSPATGTITATPYTESYFIYTHYAYCGADRNLVLHKTNGNILGMDETYTQDYGVPINLASRTGKFDDGNTNIKKMTKVEIIGNKVSSSGMIRWTDDDYVTYSSYRPVNLNLPRSQIRRCGDFRRRAIEFRHIDDVRVQLSEYEI